MTGGWPGGAGKESSAGKDAMRTEPIDTPMPPEVVGCFFERAFDPPLWGLELRWPRETLAADRSWHLPDGMLLHGPVPTRFGITVHRLHADRYQVRLMWDGRCLQWNGLTRQALLSSSLSPLLAALGTDLAYLLDQPAEAAA